MKLHQKDNGGYGRLTLPMAVGLAAPRTWAASVIPVLLGASLAVARDRRMTGWLFLVLMAISVLLQSAVNTLNDYYDFVKGTDDEENSDDPEDAVLVYNKINPVVVKRYGWGLITAAALLGIPVVMEARYVPLILALIGVAVIAAYSAGNMPISYLPIGELVSGFVMGGLLTLAVYSAMTGRADFSVFIESVPLIIGIGLIMMTNNTSDIERDRKAGRHTLPALLGRKRARNLYHVLMVLWILCTFGSVLMFHRRGWTVIVVMLAVHMESWARLWRSPLDSGARGLSMGGIASCNYALSLSYAAAILIDALLR